MRLNLTGKVVDFGEIRVDYIDMQRSCVMLDVETADGDVVSILDFSDSADNAEKMKAAGQLEMSCVLQRYGPMMYVVIDSWGVAGGEWQDVAVKGNDGSWVLELWQECEANVMYSPE